MADKYDELQCLAYVEGDLTPDQCADFERTLAEDQNLQKLVSDLQEQRRLLRSLPAEPLPDDVKDAATDLLARRMLLDDPIQDTTTITPPPRRRTTFQTRRLAIAATLIIAASVAATIYMAKQHRKEQPDSGMIALHSQTQDLDELQPTEEQLSAPNDAPAPGSRADELVTRAEPQAESRIVKRSTGKASLPSSAEQDIVQPFSDLNEDAELESKMLVAKVKLDRHNVPVDTTDTPREADDSHTKPSRDTTGDKPQLAMANTHRQQTKDQLSRKKETKQSPAPAAAPSVESTTPITDYILAESTPATESANSTPLDTNPPGAPILADTRLPGRIQTGQDQHTPNSDDDKQAIEVLYVVEDYKLGYNELLALADRYGAQVDLPGTQDRTAQTGDKTTTASDKSTLDAKAQRVILNVPETSLASIIQGITGKTSATELPKHHEDTFAVEQSNAAEAYTQKQTNHWSNAFDTLSTLWSAPFEQPPTPTLSFGLNEAAHWSPPLLPPDQKPTGAASTRQTVTHKTVVVTIQEQAPAPTE